MKPEQRVGCAQAAAFVVSGLAYPALYYAAFVVSAVASLGGGGVSLELLVGLGALAALGALALGGAFFAISRRFAPNRSRLAPLGAWLSWAVAAGASTPLIEPMWRASREGWLLVVSPALVLVASAAGAVFSARAMRS